MPMASPIVSPNMFPRPFIGSAPLARSPPKAEMGPIEPFSPLSSPIAPKPSASRTRSARDRDSSVPSPFTPKRWLLARLASLPALPASPGPAWPTSPCSPGSAVRASSLAWSGSGTAWLSSSVSISIC